MSLTNNYKSWIIFLSISKIFRALPKGFSSEAATRGVLWKRFLRNFAKFTGKNLHQSLFFNRVADLAYNFIKKETLAQVFSCEFCKTSKNILFTEHLRTTASVALSIISFLFLSFSLLKTVKTKIRK